MEIDSYVNTLANDKSETLSLTETELRLVDNTKTVCYHCGSNNHKKMVQLDAAVLLQGLPENFSLIGL